MSDINYKTFLIEFDSLFDTRLSTLATMCSDEELAEILKDNYHKRLIDVFKNVDREKFLSLYKKRDKNLIKDTLVTNAVFLIRSFIEDVALDKLYSPIKNESKLIVNLFPYSFSKEEEDNLLAGLVVMVDGKCDVELINMSLNDLTPQYIKENVSKFMMYNYYEWIETHVLNGNLKTLTCPEVELLGPGLFFDDIPNDLSFDINPFEAMEELAGPFVKLQLLPVTVFSYIIIPKK